MRTFMFLVAVVTLSLARDAQATQVGTSRLAGIGFAVGEPTGIVGKLFLGNENAIDAGLSFYRAYGRCQNKGRWENCDGDQALSLNADYLWQYNLLQGEFRLDWHIGAGGRVNLWSNNRDYNDFALAARMPVGFDFMPPKPDILEVFLEFAPTMYVAPGLAIDLQAAIGVRFYF